MKLNPFSKKPTAYYDKVKAKYDQLDHELTATKDQLNEAEADFERKRRRQFELDQHGSMYSSTREQSQASFAASEASNRVGHIKGEIGQLESRIGPLRRIALAPDRFARAKQAFDALLAQKLATTGELEKANVLIDKVSKRVIDAGARIATETQSATQTMLDAEGEFNVPDVLTRLEAELRLSKSSLAELEGKRDALLAELRELPTVIREAERVFIGCRADVVEIELYEQLMPAMTLFARASAARRQNDYRHDETRFEIEIPPELIEPAELALAAELPRA